MVAFRGRLEKATEEWNVAQHGYLVIDRLDLLSGKATYDDGGPIENGYRGIDLTDRENGHEYAGRLNDHGRSPHLGSSDHCLLPPVFDESVELGYLRVKLQGDRVVFLYPRSYVENNTNLAESGLLVVRGNGIELRDGRLDLNGSA